MKRQGDCTNVGEERVDGSRDPAPERAARPSARLLAALAFSLLVHLLLLGVGIFPESAAPARTPIRFSAALESVRAGKISVSSARETLPAKPGRRSGVLSPRPATAAVQAPGEPPLPESAPEPNVPAANPREASGESGEVFFARSQLSVAPVMLAEPVFDDSISSGAWPGRTVLRLFIDREGRVVDVREEALPDDEARAALEPLIAAFRAVRFRPGEIDGLAVNSQIRFDVDVVDEPSGSSRAGGRPSEP